MSLFAPVLPRVWRWTTPDPADNWMMVGHLLETAEGVVVLDPPMVPGLDVAITVLGGLRAIILTTHDHTRGAAWLSRQFGVPVHVPQQADRELVKRTGIEETVFYGEQGELPGGIRAQRARVTVPMWSDETYVDEMMLLVPGGAVATGDLVMGASRGRLLGCPEGLTPSPDPVKVDASLTVFRTVLPRDIHTLLASHGDDLVHSLQEAVATRMQDQ
jgi:hypothetical protein